MLGQQKHRPQLNMLVNKLKFFSEVSPQQGPLSARQPDRHLVFTSEQDLLVQGRYTPQERLLKSESQLKVGSHHFGDDRQGMNVMSKVKAGHAKKPSIACKIEGPESFTLDNQSVITSPRLRRGQRTQGVKNLESAEVKLKKSHLKGLNSPAVHSDADKAGEPTMKKYRSTRNLNSDKSTLYKPKVSGLGYQQNSLQNTGLYNELATKLASNKKENASQFHHSEYHELSDSMQDPLSSLRNPWAAPERLNQTFNAAGSRQIKQFERVDTGESQDDSHYQSLHEPDTEHCDLPGPISVQLKDKKTKVFSDFFSGLNETDNKDGYLLSLQKAKSHQRPEGSKANKPSDRLQEHHAEYGVIQRPQERKTLAGVFGLEEPSDSIMSRSSCQGPADDPFPSKRNSMMVATKASPIKSPPKKNILRANMGGESNFDLTNSVARGKSPKTALGKSRISKKATAKKRPQEAIEPLVSESYESECQSLKGVFRSRKSIKGSLKQSFKDSKNSTERASFKKGKPKGTMPYSVTDIGSLTMVGDQYQIHRLAKIAREKFCEVNQNNSAFIKPDNDSTMVIGIDSLDVNKSVEIYDRLIDMPTGKKTAMRLPETSQLGSKETIDYSGSGAWVLEESPKDDDPAKEEATKELERQTKLNPLTKNLHIKIKNYFTQKEIKIESEYPTSISHYELLKCIGKGAFGKVHLGTQVLTGRKVALKTVGKKYLAMDSDNKKKVENEIGLLMKTCKCKHVVKLLEVFESKDYYFLVTEYAAGGDLATIIKSKGGFSEEEAKPVFIGVIDGLRELHSMKVVHRDLKPENIVLSEKGKACIADLGMSKEVEQGELLRDTCGTPVYEAPECMNLEKGYDGIGADIWTLGVLLYQMIYARPPFKADKVEDLYTKIACSELTFPTAPDVSSSLKDLLRRILQKDPIRRLNLDEARSHLWLDSCHETETSERDATARLKNERFTAYYIQGLGFPKKYVTDSLRQGVFNHATACYYTMQRGKNKT